MIVLGERTQNKSRYSSKHGFDAGKALSSQHGVQKHLINSSGLGGDFVVVGFCFFYVVIIKTWPQIN